jgi:hypothetical protein
MIILFEIIKFILIISFLFIVLFYFKLFNSYFIFVIENNHLQVHIYTINFL